MNQSEKPKFEQEWQRAFEPAAETPPPAAWDAIEKRLDAEQAAVVPLLWWKNPKVWYAAAAVAALLLVSWPMLESYNREVAETATKLTAEETVSPEMPRVKKTPGVAAPEIAASDVTTSGAESVIDERIAAGEIAKPELSTAPPLIRTGSPERAAVARRNPVQVISPSSLDIAEAAQNSGAEESGQEETFSDAALAPKALISPTPTVIVITHTTRKIPTGSGAFDELNRVIMGSSTAPLRTRALTQPIAALSSMTELGKLNIDLRQPAVRNDLAVLDVGTAARPRHSRVREFWAGLGLMPAAFDPRMNVTSAPQAFANAKAGRQSLSNASRARLSFAVQAQAGKQLSERWSVETGLSYLQGNSTFASGGYVLDAVTNQSTSVLENALVSNSTSFYSSSRSPGINSDLNFSTGSYIDFDQRTSNDFRYVQLPVQAGYTLNPDGKLNYTVLGGVVANLFLQNEIKNNAGDVSTNTADDGLYRALNWSATTGVRVNYRLGDHWNTSLTGSYQKAIASILKGDGVLEARPQLYGMSWGVRYVF